MKNAEESEHSHNHKHLRCRLTKTQSILLMLFMTFSFFLVELVVGHITKSNSLIADSFHMLSDVLSLIIGLIAVRMAKKKTPRNTFGWVRSEGNTVTKNLYFYLYFYFIKSFGITSKLSFFTGTLFLCNN